MVYLRHTRIGTRILLGYLGTQTWLFESYWGRYLGYLGVSRYPKLVVLIELGKVPGYTECSGVPGHQTLTCLCGYCTGRYTERILGHPGNEPDGFSQNRYSGIPGHQTLTCMFGYYAGRYTERILGHPGTEPDGFSHTLVGTKAPPEYSGYPGTKPYSDCLDYPRVGTRVLGVPRLVALMHTRVDSGTPQVFLGYPGTKP